MSSSVADLLRAVPVEAENTTTYDRAYFEHWIDADGNGCDTRQEVLVAESTVPVVRSGTCTVTSGRWESWYDGGVWTVPGDVDIDHMVPLSEAWDSGANAWTAEQRRDYANDLTIGASLVAVTDNINQSKGEKDPAQWLPPSSGATCRYISDWVVVKYRWNLTADQAEVDALNTLLAGPCAGATAEVPPRASTPSSTAAIAAYVTKVYRDLFDRDPDPAGLAGWTTALAQGTAYGEVANGITYSREFRASLIRSSYQRYLGREPDAAGLEGWLQEMDRGLHIEQMQAGFIASPEFYAKAGSDPRQWVIDLYATVLDRAPAEAEITYWVERLANGANRWTVAIGFLYSTEHLTSVVDGYYLDLLRRNIDPSGTITWVGAIQSGARDEQIIASIVSSAEYRGNV